MADLVVAGDLGARRTQFLLSTMSRTAALDRLTSKLDIVFEPLAPSAVLGDAIAVMKNSRGKDSAALIALSTRNPGRSSRIQYRDDTARLERQFSLPMRQLHYEQLQW
jgi:hypothetical protein